jgi:hypothetical protein
MKLFRKREKPLGPPKLWVSTQEIKRVGYITRIFFKETLDLPDTLELEQVCNRLEYVTGMRAYMSYVAVDWKEGDIESRVSGISGVVLKWLKEFNSQPPVCDWSLEPQIITVPFDSLSNSLWKILHEEGLDLDRWVLGMH